MARGLTEFTVQQAVNFEAFSDWNYEELNMGAASDTNVSATYITSINPAKKVVIFLTADAADALDAADVLTLTINGETATNKLIKIDIGDMPFTLSGLAVTSLAIATSDHDSGEELAVLSFH